jgi:hypothetical protein
MRAWHIIPVYPFACAVCLPGADLTEVLGGKPDGLQHVRLLP